MINMIILTSVISVGLGDLGIEALAYTQNSPFIHSFTFKETTDQVFMKILPEGDVVLYKEEFLTSWRSSASAFGPSNI